MTTPIKFTSVLCAVVLGTITFFTNQIATAAETDAQSQKIETHRFKVDPNIFYRNLESKGSLDASQAALARFKDAGVDLTAPGRAVFFNDGLKTLFVKATESELNTVERTIEILNSANPQIHIKTRFVEVPENEIENILRAGTAVDTKEKNTVEIIDAEKAESLLRQLDSASGVDTLGEPEVVTASLRQTQMRSSDSDNITATMDLVPALLADSFTVNLQAFVSKPETLNAHANIWDGQTLALIAPKSDGKSRLVVFVTATVVNSAGNRIYSEKQKLKSNIPPQQ